MSKGRPSEPDEGSHNTQGHITTILLTVEESVKERPSEEEGSSPRDLANQARCCPSLSLY